MESRMKRKFHVRVWVGGKLGDYIKELPINIAGYKFYDRLTARGYLIQQFNLQVPMKTNIYNPLGLIADMVRMGDSSGASEAMVALAEVFFPTEGAQDPMWPNGRSQCNKAFLHMVL